MRVGIGAIVQTSNGFSARWTSLDAFRRRRLIAGAELGENGFQDPICATLADTLETEGIEVIPLVEALAPAGGPLDETAAGWIYRSLIEAVDHGEQLDRVILHLSGAMLVGQSQPGEVALVDRLAETLKGETPIWLVLGSRANLTPELLERAELVLGAFGHSDNVAADVAARLRQPAVTSQNQTERFTCRRGPFYFVPLPNQRPDHPAVQALAKVREEVEGTPEVITANITLGFPYADTPNTGVSIWVTALSDDSARIAADRLEAALARQRDALTQVDNLFNIEEAVHRAMANPDSTSILLDTGDDPAGGAPGDGTGLLWALLDLGARDALLAPLADAAAVEQAFLAGEGGSFTSEVGARIDRRHGYPVQVRGEVVKLLERVGGHDSGRAALLRAEGRHGGNVLVVLTERPIIIDDLSILSSLGIDPRNQRIVGVKASTLPLKDSLYLSTQPEVRLVATPGITVPDFSYFPYQRLAPGVLPATTSAS